MYLPNLNLIQTLLPIGAAICQMVVLLTIKKLNNIFGLKVRFFVQKNKATGVSAF